jgi:hypothetical protein
MGAAMTTFLERRGGPTLEQAEQRYEHGTRARYVIAKCRCFPCKLANADYVTQMADKKRLPWRLVRGRGHYVEHRDTGKRVACADRASAYRERDRRNARNKPESPNELIATRAVRRHLKSLEAAGVGLRAVSIAAGVNRGVLQRMVRGEIRKTRRSTADRILEIGTRDVQPGALIDAAPTWKLLDVLIVSGYKKCWISKQLGSKGRALQLNRTSVTAANAAKVRALYDRLWMEDADLRMRVDPHGERTRKERQAEAGRF